MPTIQKKDEPAKLHLGMDRGSTTNHRTNNVVDYMTLCQDAICTYITDRCTYNIHKNSTVISNTTHSLGHYLVITGQNPVCPSVFAFVCIRMRVYVCNSYTMATKDWPDIV